MSVILYILYLYQNVGLWYGNLQLDYYIHFHS